MTLSAILRRRPRFAGLVALLPLAQPGAALAAEWAVDGAVDVRLRMSDNLDLRATEPKVHNTMRSLSPNARFASRTEAREIAGSVAVTLNQPSNPVVTSTADYLASVEGSWKRDERTQLRLALVLQRDSTQQSELAATGVVLVRRQRTQARVAPSIQWALDEKTVAGVGYTASVVRYERAAGLADYTDQAVSLNGQRAFSERLVLSAGMSRRRFRADPLLLPVDQTATTAMLIKTATTTDTDSVSVGLQYQPGERLQLKADVGLQNSKTDQDVRTSLCLDPVFFPGVLFPIALCQSGGFALTDATASVATSYRAVTYSADAGYRMEAGNLSAAVARALNASGSGSLLQTDRVGVSYLWRRSDTFSAGLDASILRSRTIDGAASESRYLMLSPKLTWQIDPQLSFGAAFTRAQQRQGPSAPVARANELLLTLSYQFQPLTASR